MANKTLLARLGITKEDIKRIYEEEQTIEATARRLGCSKPTIIKYLRHIQKNKRPWKTKPGKRLPRIATAGFQDAVHKDIVDQLFNKKIWIDIEQRRIPAAAVRAVYFELPETVSPVVPLYAILRDGTRVVLLHVVKGVPECAESNDDGSRKQPPNDGISNPGYVNDTESS